MNINDVVKYYLSYPVTSPFGDRVIFGEKQFHKGVDLSYPGYEDEGNPIYSMIDGIVFRVSYQPEGAGNYIVIGKQETDQYKTEVKFFHLKETPKFRSGDRIKIGDIIGHVGTTGRSTGPHIHMERLENGSHIDPIPWLKSLMVAEYGMFKDVEKGKWYSESIEKAAKYGLMMGRDKGFFFPDSFVTRAELATVAVRLFEKTNEDFVEVINQVLPAVVQIETPQGLGSGTIIHEDGYVLTNAHVVRDNEKVSFLSPDPVFDGSTYAEGPVIKVDKEKDLSLCKIQLPAKFPTLKLTQYEPSQSEKVLVIGSPLGLIRSVSDGIVSGIRTMQNETYIQTDAEINPGNSGGALVNLRGELIGVPSWKLSSVEIEGLNFAIHHKEIRNFLKDTKLAL